MPPPDMTVAEMRYLYKGIVTAGICKSYPRLLLEYPSNVGLYTIEKIITLF